MQRLVGLLVRAVIRPKSSDPPGNFFRKVISSFHPLLLVKHANLYVYGTRACGFRSGRGTTKRLFIISSRRPLRVCWVLGLAVGDGIAAAVGIVTMYGRPFTNNARIGTISTSLVPTEFEALHAKLMEFRHKEFAHSDFTGQLPGHGKMTEVRLVFDGRTVADFSSRPIFEPVLLPH